jgi:hypothetical protein
MGQYVCGEGMELGFLNGSQVGDRMKTSEQLHMVVHDCNPSTGEDEAGGS